MDHCVLEVIGFDNKKTPKAACEQNDGTIEVERELVKDGNVEG